jgi:hypothetical protein
MCNPQSYVKVCVCVCENEVLIILVKWVYEHNQVITMREFVNLNIQEVFW